MTANVNSKGVLDIDSVKGCRLGMEAYPAGGCYGLCYAAKIAKFYKYDFNNSVSRLIEDDTQQLPLFNGVVFGGNMTVFNVAKNHKMDWFRIGTMGDPSHDWNLTSDLCCWLGKVKTPVIVSKHWIEIPGYLLTKLKNVGAVINTSISPLDTDSEINYRLGQFERFKSYGITSVLRVVSCRFGDTETGARLNKIQGKLFNSGKTIDTPLRIPKTDKRVVNGDILTETINGNNISLINNNTHIGTCSDCVDRCGTMNN